MTLSTKVHLDRERIAARFAEGVAANEDDDPDHGTMVPYGHDPEEETQGSPSPEVEPARETDAPREPETTPPVTQPEPSASYDINKDLLEQNRELTRLLQQQFQQRTTGGVHEQPVERRPQPQQQQQGEEDYRLLTNADLRPFQGKLSEVETLANLFVTGSVSEVERRARQEYADFRDRYKDREVDKLVSPQLVDAAIQGLKRRAHAAIKSGQPFSYNLTADLQREFDANEAPLLRAEKEKQAAEAAAKAKQQEELKKVQGMPTKGARYQKPNEGSNTREKKKGEDWRTRLNRRVNDTIRRTSAET